jgi:hypothetical protein
MSLNNFIAQVKSKGLARSNRFSVLIPFPFATGAQPRDILIMCDTVTMPGISISTAQNRIWGEQREMPYEALFGNATFTFYVEPNLTVKDTFEQWMTNIRNPRTRTFNYYANYIADVTINVHSIENDDEIMHTVTLHEAYPQILNPIQLDYSSRDVMKYSVSMNYKYYTTQKMTMDTPLPTSPLPNQDAQGTFTGQGFDTSIGPTNIGKAIT